jgi:GGDEF domain-containing protein
VKKRPLDVPLQVLQLIEQGKEFRLRAFGLVGKPVPYIGVVLVEQRLEAGELGIRHGLDARIAKMAEHEIGLLAAAMPAPIAQAFKPQLARQWRIGLSDLTHVLDSENACNIVQMRKFASAGWGMAQSDMAEKESRKGDGVLLVTQDNAQRRLIVGGANDTAANILGYEAADLRDRELQEILGQRTRDMLEEELEFAEEAPDFGDIFSRQRDIRLRTRLGEEVALPCTVSRLMAEGRTARFHLVLPDEREKRAKQQLREFLKTNLEGRQQLDAATGLPDRATAETYLGLLKSYTASHELSTAFAVLRLDRHEKSLARYGKQGCLALLQHVAERCRVTFRSEDVVSVLSDHTLGLILFDISRESVRLVLNRLRWNIGSYHIDFGGKPNFSVTVSVAFDMLDSERGDGLLGRCEQAIGTLDKETRNGLVELGS